MAWFLEFKDPTLHSQFLYHDLQTWNFKVVKTPIHASRWWNVASVKTWFFTKSILVMQCLEQNFKVITNFFCSWYKLTDQERTTRERLLYSKQSLGRASKLNVMIIDNAIPQSSRKSTCTLFVNYPCHIASAGHLAACKCQCGRADQLQACACAYWRRQRTLPIP